MILIIAARWRFFLAFNRMARFDNNFYTRKQNLECAHSVILYNILQIEFYQRVFFFAFTLYFLMLGCVFFSLGAEVFARFNQDYGTVRSQDAWDCYFSFSLYFKWWRISFVYCLVFFFYLEVRVWRRMKLKLIRLLFQGFSFPNHSDSIIFQLVSITRVCMIHTV